LGKDRDLVIGFTYNLLAPTKDYTLDYLRRYSEWDSATKIESITRALEETGNRVIQIPVDRDILSKLRSVKEKIDIVFNIAEGLSSELIEGNLREALIPTFLEFLQIPYTGSGPMSQAECLDKARAKDIAGAFGVRSAKSQLVWEVPFRMSEALQFPIVVKLNSEGSSLGMTQASRLDSANHVDRLVRRLIKEYRQPILIEEFIGGTEYTVGIVGNLIMPVMKVELSKLPNSPSLRDQEVKDLEPEYTFLNNPSSDKNALTLAQFSGLYDELAWMAATAHEALRCRDFNRLDFRERKGRPYMLELNPLPGMHPTDGDLPVMARAAGIDFGSLVNMVLLEAIKRYRADDRFSERFAARRTNAIAERVNKMVSRLGFFPKKITTFGKEYCLLRPSDSVQCASVFAEPAC